MAGGEQAIPSKLWTERDFRPEHAQEADEMTINFQEPKAHVSVMLSTQNVSIVNPIMQKLHALGFTLVQRPVNNPQVAGRISHFATNWKTITEDQWILRTVQGFLIPFREEPRQVCAPQPCRFSEDQMKLLCEEVSSLLGKGAVVTVEPAASEEGFYSTLFLVPKTEGRMRPVINLKALNFWVHPQHFKMEGIHTLWEIVAQDEWFAKLDLKDAYFTVPIHRDHWKFLCFMVDQVCYQFRHMSAIRSILCFLGFYQGAKASFCFPEKCRSLLYRLYRRYPSDREDPGRSSESRGVLRGCLDRSIRGSGFHSQYGKICVGSFPANRIPGVTVEYSQYVPDSSWSQDEKLLSFSARANSVRKLAQFIGKLNAASQAVFPAPLFYRHLHRDLQGALARGSQNYETTLQLSHAGVPGGGSMVAGPPDPMEWSNLVEPSATVGDSVGRKLIYVCINGHLSWSFMYAPVWKNGFAEHWS